MPSPTPPLRTRSRDSSPPPKPSRSMMNMGTNNSNNSNSNNNRATSMTDKSQHSAAPAKLGRPRKMAPRQRTWGPEDHKRHDNKSPNNHNSNNNNNSNISVAKTINHLLHIPANRCCADCRSALVDSSQVHASFRPPRNLQELSQSNRRLAFTRSDFSTSRFFSKTHKQFAPPPFVEENRRKSSGYEAAKKSSSMEDTQNRRNTHSSGYETSKSSESTNGNNRQGLDRSTYHGSGKEITTLNPYADAESDVSFSLEDFGPPPPNGGFYIREAAKEQQQQAEPKKEIVDPALLAFRYVWGHGVFLCAQCAQAHKLLGDSVTIVRHVQEYHTWTPAEALAMKHSGGNPQSWKIYEAHLPEYWRRKRPDHASNMSDRLTFCRAKYEAMGFIFPRIMGDEQAWHRLLKRNAWAQVNPGPAADLRNLLTFVLERNNALHLPANNNNAGNIGMAMAAGAPLTQLPTRLIDYFCVIGSSGFLDPRILQGEKVDLSNLEGPEDVFLEPRVIDCFPPPQEHSDMEFPEHVATFVLPEGCRPSESQKSPFFFTFVLTSATGHRLYGGVLRLYDEAIETQALREIMEKSGYEGPYPSWLPDTTTSTPDHSGLSADSSDCMDIVYLPKCLVVLSHYPFIDLFRNFLLQLYRITLVRSPLPVERFIANFCCEVPLPPQGKVEVKFGFTVKDIWSVQRPPENQLPLANFSFKPLFACLSAGNIMTLVGCLLTESRIALCSRHYALLTPIAEALLSFLFPLQWQGMYIPIMPYAMLDILDAPVPFLVGLHARYLIENKPPMRPQGVVYVDVDRDIIHLGFDEDTNSPRMVPALPEKGAQKLRAKIEEFASLLYLTPDNAKMEGNTITTAHGSTLPDYRRDAYAATYQPASSTTTASEGGSLPGTEEMRRAQRHAPKRRTVLRSVDKAYQENELLTPIKGFLSEQGQLYNHEPIRQLRVQKSGNGGMGTKKGKHFFRRLRSQSSLREYEDEQPSQHPFSGHFTQSPTNHSNRGIHGLLLDMEEPVGFNSYEVRHAFLRFFVSLLKNYDQFMNMDNPNVPFREEEFLADLNLSIPSYGFVKKTVKTQMFMRFLEDKQNDPCDPLFLFFDESIIAKQNRTKKFQRTRDTPFLDDPSGAITETFTPPPPSNWGLPADERKYQYGSFPRFNHELFGKIRAPMKWKMSRSRSSLRNLQSPSSSLPHPSWQHEILTRSLTPSVGSTGTMYWAAKTGMKTLEAAINALSDASPHHRGSDSSSSLFNLSSSNFSFSSLRKGAEPDSPTGRKSPASPGRKHPLRTSFAKGSVSAHTLMSAEKIVLDARRMKGVLLDTLVKMQAAARGYLQRKRYYRFLRALRFLQYKWRRQIPDGLTEMDELDRARHAIHSLQRIVRAFLLTRQYRRKRASVALLQRWYRGAICRKRINQLVRACKRIQTLVRSRRAQLAFRLLHLLLAKMQARWRGYQTREHITLRNERRMSRYREQIVLLWSRLHTPLSYRTKFWPLISEKCGFLRLRIAESELERLWIELEVDFHDESTKDLNIGANNTEEFRLGSLLGINDYTFWRYLKVKEMTSSVLLFPAEERRNNELRLASDRVEAERIQVYERLSADTPKIAAMLVTLYDMFNIDKRNKNKKYRLTEAIWSDQINANQSEMLMMQVFPELEEASNIIFNEPRKKTLKRFRNVNPTPPRLGKSFWAHSILNQQISRNVREVAVNALQGTQLPCARPAASKSTFENVVAKFHANRSVSRSFHLKSMHRELIDDLLVNRKWEGKKERSTVELANLG